MKNSKINPKINLDQISNKLIDYIRKEVKDPKINYDKPLTSLTGGYENHLFKFSITHCSFKNKLANNLVLRLFPFYQNKTKSIWETAIHRGLLEQGYLVPKVFFSSMDTKILGNQFLIMEFIQAKTMVEEMTTGIYDMLGKAQATLHKIEIEPIIKTLKNYGFSKKDYTLMGNLNFIRHESNKFSGNCSWLKEPVNWLIKNCPTKTKKLSICHVDFHPLNILVKNKKISSVIDWGDFLIADPMLDVASTVLLCSIAAKHLLPNKILEKHIKMYLDSYKNICELDITNFDYYKVLRCVKGLLSGAKGEIFWSEPAIKKNLINYIDSTTKLSL